MRRRLSGPEPCPTDTWIGPVFQMLYPDLVRDSILGYRFNVRRGAEEKAKSYHLKYICHSNYSLNEQIHSNDEYFECPYSKSLS